MSEITVDPQQVRIFAALADPLRLRFVYELADGTEHSGSEIAERLGISLALLCHHSRILVESGVVLKRKEAQTAYYKANKKILKDCMKSLTA